MPLLPHSTAWYDRLATMQQGYSYNWESHFDPWHGEDVYRPMVHQHLHSDMDVLDIACAQGEVALEIAPSCRSVVGYDRIATWIHMAQRAAHERGLTNTTFLCHDSSIEANGGRAHLPAAEAAFDLLICGKGPFHWIEDARRVARPGAVLLMLVPDATPLTAWTEQLPEPLRWQAGDPHWARPAIEQRLRIGQLSLHSWWSFDVPELFPDAEALYSWRTWGSTPDEVPSFAEVAADLERIFTRYAGPRGLEIRRRRHIWKAIVPK
ncbi:MAG TPA: class I SAM-dependent methyltransferase [Anaerolineales bacterium]|nr:class I SAM-dependent methyltransferase [Anaerolineales bacterium]